MSPPGPRPKPTQLKILHGDLRYQRNAEPKPRPSRPSCPAWMTPAARKEWKLVVAEVAAMQMLSAADRASLVTYVEAIVMHRAASELVDKFGIIIKGRDGNMVKNPAAQIVRDTSGTILRVAEQFGLTPSARSRMSVPATQHEDELERRYLTL